MCEIKKKSGEIHRRLDSREGNIGEFEVKSKKLESIWTEIHRKRWKK